MAIKKYQEFVNKGINEKSPLDNAIRSILGNGVFKEKVHKYLKVMQDKIEIPEIKTFEIKYEMEDILKEIAIYYGVKEDELLKRKKTTQHMRRIAIFV